MVHWAVDNFYLVISLITHMVYVLENPSHPQHHQEASISHKQSARKPASTPSFMAPPSLPNFCQLHIGKFGAMNTQALSNPLGLLTPKSLSRTLNPKDERHRTCNTSCALRPLPLERLGLQVALTAGTPLPARGESGRRLKSSNGKDLGV